MILLVSIGILTFVFAFNLIKRRRKQNQYSNRNIDWLHHRSANQKQKKWFNFGFWNAKLNQRFHNCCEQLVLKMIERFDCSKKVKTNFLDIGSGKGVQTDLLIQKLFKDNETFEMIALEPSYDVKSRRNVVCLQKTFEQFVVERSRREFFDCILACDSAYHLKGTYEELYSLFFAMMADDGELATCELMCLNEERSLLRLLFLKLLSKMFDAPRFSERVTVNQLTIMLQDIGFVDVDISVVTDNVLKPFLVYLKRRLKHCSSWSVWLKFSIFHKLMTTAALDYVIVKCRKKKKIQK